MGPNERLSSKTIFLGIRKMDCPEAIRWIWGIREAAIIGATGIALGATLFFEVFSQHGLLRVCENMAIHGGIAAFLTRSISPHDKPQT
jgi:hypothetical protein